jgi:hypothetical protein
MPANSGRYDFQRPRAQRYASGARAARPGAGAPGALSLRRPDVRIACGFGPPNVAPSRARRWALGNQADTVEDDITFR